MTQTLRVLNAARYYEIGLPITLEQYRQNSPELFLSRLILRSHHLLAIRIAEFLKLSNAPVLRHWASVKVLEAKGANEDDRICQLLVERLKTQMEVAPADVARTAWATGQTALATKVHFLLLTMFSCSRRMKSCWITNRGRLNKSLYCLR